jgi:hypothetical protein
MVLPPLAAEAVLWCGLAALDGEAEINEILIYNCTDVKQVV